MLVFLSVALVIISTLILFVLLLFLFLAIDVFLDLPYVATQKEKIETIIKLAKIRKGETVVDLGSGDGRLLFVSAQRGAKAIGYEINPFLVILTKIRIRLKGISENIKVYQRDLWKADLKIADVIFVYGRKKTMQKFQDFVYKKAKKGTRIVVNTNPFPNKKPLKIKNKIFMYQAPKFIL